MGNGREKEEAGERRREKKLEYCFGEIRIINQ